MINELEERLRMHWKQDYRRLYEIGEKVIRDWTPTDFKGRRMVDPDLYSFNIRINQTMIHDFGIWWDLTTREGLVAGLVRKLQQNINSRLDNNYKRHPGNQIDIHWVCEHFSREDSTKLIHPHCHGTLAVSSATKEKFKTLLVKGPDESFSLDLKLVGNAGGLIDSTYLRNIPSEGDLCYWMGYTMKQALNDQGDN